MKKILLVAALLVVCGSVAAQAMGDLYVSGTWRYKMTVVVETPEGTKTGSAVREVSNSASSVKLIDLPQATNPAKVRGEAVVVDLGKRGVLFALISDHQSAGEFYYAFPAPGGRPTTVDGIRYYNSLKEGHATIEPKKYSEYARLVTFTDLNDPKTVQSVDNQSLVNFFGDGVKIKEITLDITNESVTWEIEKWLPWLEHLNANLDGTSITTGKSFANMLHVGYFKRGEK